MPTTSNMRQFERLNDEFNVRMSNVDYATKRIMHIYNASKSVNVSGSGILIKSSEKIDPGTTVRIFFIKPNSFDFFKGYGRVVRLERSSENEFKVALNFIDQSPDEIKALDYCVKQGKKM